MQMILGFEIKPLQSVTAVANSEYQWKPEMVTLRHSPLNKGKVAQATKEHLISKMKAWSGLQQIKYFIYEIKEVAVNINANLCGHFRLRGREPGAGVKYHGCHDELVVCLGSNFKDIAALIRGNLNAKAHGNPEPSRKGKTFQACVETIQAESRFLKIGIKRESDTIRKDGLTERTTPTYSSGVAGLNGVVMIVFAAIRYIVAMGSNLHRKTCQIRGNLSRLLRYGNPELNRLFSRKCVETRGYAPIGIWVMG